MFPSRLFLLVSAAVLLVLGAGGASPAAAASPWWHMTDSLRPAKLQPGGETTFVSQVINLGTAPTSGPITLTAKLPSGLEIPEEESALTGEIVPKVSFFSYVQQRGRGPGDLGPGGFLANREMCDIEPLQVTCTTVSQNPEKPFALPDIQPYEELEIRIKVKDVSAAPGSAIRLSVSGGQAPTLTTEKALGIGEPPTGFGAEDLSIVPEEEGGAIDTRAASHPFQLTTTFNLNQTADPAHPPALPRTIDFRLPPGQIGNATALPKCSATDFSAVVQGVANTCPADTAIGVAFLSFYEPANLHAVSWPVPLFNLAPAYGEPARFGFSVVQSPVILDTSLRAGPGEDYGVTVSTNNVSQLINFITSTVTFWGAPGDSLHDQSRGWNCLAGGSFELGEPCNPTNQPKPPAFLTLPTDCAHPFNPVVEGVSWPNLASPGGALMEPLEYSLHDPAGAPLSLSACNQVPFEPRIHSEPTSNAATSATGLSFSINFVDEGLSNAEGLAQSQIKKAVVTLPQGFTTNPSVAEGLQACGLDQFEAETVDSAPGAGWPKESKIGDLAIEIPMVGENVDGSH
jgi:hypothetical protein